MKIIAMAALAVFCAALALTACGSDDAAEQAQQQQQATATVEQPSELTEQQTVAEQAQAAPEAQQQQAAQEQQAVEESEPQAEESQQAQSAEPAASESSDQQRQQQSTAAVEGESTQEDAQEEEAAQPQSQAQQSAQTAEQAQAQAREQEEREAQQAREREREAQRERERAAEATLQARAEEIAADASVSDLVGVTAWLNGEPTTIARELAKGNVVLIDFWTYTCVNCVRTFPFLREWHAKYADRGLTIISVHSPEFEFEEEVENIRQALEQYDLRYLVAQDNDFRTWRAFNNRYWPAKYLIGPAMDIRYQHFGEGDYLETEHEIRRALMDAGHDVSDIEEGTEAVAPVRDPESRGQTRELYGGTRRNYGRVQYAAQPEYYLEAGTAQLYNDVQGSLNSRLQARENHKWYLQGLWRNEEEAIVHARTTEDLEDYLAFKFTSRTVNVVLTVPEDGEPFNVYIEMDGRWLRPQEAGADIVFDGDERSYVRVTRDDLYRLVVLDEWSTHELKLRSNSDQLEIFAFTFGSYLGGE